METEHGAEDIQEINELKKGLFGTLLEILFYPDKSFHYLMFTSLCMSVQYYCLTFLIPLYFSVEFGYSDLEAGVIFGLFGVFVGIFSIIFSYFIYQVSLRRGLLMSAGLGIVGFGLLAFNEKYSSLVGIIFEAASCSIAWPYLEYGIKVHSSDSHRFLCSSLYFISIYTAGVISGILIDGLNEVFQGKKEVFTVIYLICIVSLLLAGVFILMCSELYIKKEYKKGTIKEIFTEKKFLKFFSIILILISLRTTCFGHFDATLPKYLQRVHGKNSKFGFFIAIHSAIMILNIFFCTKLTEWFSNPNLIIFGNCLAVLGTLPLAFSNSYFAFASFVFGTSFGEAILAPRLLDYTYFVAKDKQEGVYLALSSLPFYFAMIGTGVSSGEELEKYCPEKGENCNFVWRINFLCSFFELLLFFCVKKWIFESEAKQEIIELVKIGEK